MTITWPGLRAAQAKLQQLPVLITQTVFSVSADGSPLALEKQLRKVGICMELGLRRGQPEHTVGFGGKLPSFRQTQSGSPRRAILSYDTGFLASSWTLICLRGTAEVGSQG